jgi:hypothetical protein
MTQTFGAVTSTGLAEYRLESARGAGGAAMLRHPPSGVLFLPWHRGFRLEQVHRYDGPGHNVSARYVAGPTALVSVYVFPPDASPSGAAFGATFEASVRDMLASLAPALWANERGTAFASPGGRVVAGRRVEAAGYAQGAAGRPRHALVEMFTHRAWALKVRATYQPELGAEVDAFVCAWLAASSFAAPAPGKVTPRRSEG